MKQIVSNWEWDDSEGSRRLLDAAMQSLRRNSYASINSSSELLLNENGSRTKENSGTFLHTTPSFSRRRISTGSRYAQFKQLKLGRFSKLLYGAQNLFANMTRKKKILIAALLFVENGFEKLRLLAHQILEQAGVFLHGLRYCHLHCHHQKKPTQKPHRLRGLKIFENLHQPSLKSQILYIFVASNFDEKHGAIDC